MPCTVILMSFLIWSKSLSLYHTAWISSPENSLIWSVRFTQTWGQKETLLVNLWISIAVIVSVVILDQQTGECNSLLLKFPRFCESNGMIHHIVCLLAEDGHYSSTTRKEREHSNPRSKIVRIVILAKGTFRRFSVSVPILKLRVKRNNIDRCSSSSTNQNEVLCLVAKQVGEVT